jgi:hypothetical protein
MTFFSIVAQSRMPSDTSRQFSRIHANTEPGKCRGEYGRITFTYFVARRIMGMKPQSKLRGIIPSALSRYIEIQLTNSAVPTVTFRLFSFVIGVSRINSCNNYV